MESGKNIGQYQILKTLGTGGSCKVKLAYDTENNNKRVAVKILNDNLGDEEKTLLFNEIKQMQTINHENVVKYLDHGQREYTKSNGKTRVVSYIALEICEGGELFDFVANTGSFEESVCRYYFKQLINGLKGAHDSGVFHRDMKAENMFMDSNYDLKVGDFGFAAAWGKADSNGLFQTLLGTPGYMAPEIHLEQRYNGAQVDIFASGIILFIMLAGHPPFGKASPKDAHYKALAMGNTKAFWKAHSRNKKGGEAFFTPDFKDFCEQIWTLDPNQRITMDGILAHPWMAGEVPSRSAIQQEFKSRNAKNMQEKEAERLENKENKAAGTHGAYRGGDGALTPHTPMKAIKEYIKVNDYNTVILSNNEPDAIEAKIVEILEQNQIKVSSDQAKYKIKFEQELSQSKDDVSFGQKIEVQIKITKVNDVTCAIEFTKLQGNQMLFLQDFAEKKDKTFKEFAIEESVKA